ncbi:hypothetical protein LguiA_002831 [Lonicera macranthoides]
MGIKSWRTPPSLFLHAAKFAFDGVLVVFIQVKYPGTPTAFETHNVCMIISFASMHS